MSADHLSLCSSELREEGETHERVRGGIQAGSICLLGYVTAAGMHMRTHKHSITHHTAINAWVCWVFVDGRVRAGAALFTPKPH